MCQGVGHGEMYAGRVLAAPCLLRGHAALTQAVNSLWRSCQNLWLIQAFSLLMPHALNTVCPTLVSCKPGPWTTGNSRQAFCWNCSSLFSSREKQLKVKDGLLTVSTLSGISTFTCVFPRYRGMPKWEILFQNWGS